MKAKLCGNTPYRRQSLSPRCALQSVANHLWGYSHAIVLGELDVKQKLVLWSRQSEEVLYDGLQVAEWSTTLRERRSARTDENTTAVGRHVEHVASVIIGK